MNKNNSASTKKPIKKSILGKKSLTKPVKTSLGADKVSTNLKTKNSASKIWGGRFAEAPCDLMQKINQSIGFDKRLYRQDICASIAHAKMLETTKIISKSDYEKIASGLKEIEQEISLGIFVFREELEDIHMNIESVLHQKIGEPALRLHTARSRNDQVATDFRLFVRDCADETMSLLLELMNSLVLQAKNNSLTNDLVVMPGFTHLQIAQPVLFAHHFLAYFEMFKRDFSRLSDCKNRLNECPLGACALAGTSHPIDRFQTAKQLGFERPTANSMDSVSDRDFVIEFLFCLSLISNHLSRLAEELVLWMSKGFGFVSLSDKFTSGSSIMPQKRNPDAAELVRGKTGRVYGSLISLLTTMKGLTLTYSKDMQEDKEPLFDSFDSVKLCLQAMAGMIYDLKINQENMAKMAEADFSCATELADWLVKNLKIPFRQSHHLTGSLVKLAENQGKALNQLALAEMKKIEPKISAEIFLVLNAKAAVAAKTSYGGTAFSEVSKQIKLAEGFINQKAMNLKAKPRHF